MRLIFVLLLMSYFSSSAQKSKHKKSVADSNAEWFEGKVILNDGSEHKGLVKYEDGSDAITFQDGGDLKILTSARVSSFEFYDMSHQKKRTFYSFPYQDPRTDIVRPIFFEVIKEYKTFAVIYTGPVYLSTESNSLNPLDNLAYSKDFYASQTETIYLIDSRGEIKPYIESVKKDIDNHNGKNIKETGKLIDDDLLIQFIKEPFYRQLTDFAKENHLKFKLKEDFLKILEYYDTLIE